MSFYKLIIIPWTSDSYKLILEPAIDCILKEVKNDILQLRQSSYIEMCAFHQSK